MQFFPAQGGGGGLPVIVAGPDPGVIGQWHDLLLQGGEELGEGAAGEVGAARGPHEQGVAGKEVAREIEADGAGGVTRGVQDLRLLPSQRQALAVLHQEIGAGQGRVALGQRLGLPLRAPEELPVQSMDGDAGFGLSGPKVVAGGVVGMAMGVDDPGKAPAFLVQALGQNPGRAPGSMSRASRLSEQATR